MSQNPLNQYFRSVSQYVKLPSGTSYYSPDVIKFTEDGELGIMAMTSKDEISLKNPDALLNGAAVTEVLKSCVPTLTDPKKILQNDIEAIIVAIRKATYGDNMEFSTTCPKCSHKNSYEASLSHILGTASGLEPEYKVELDSGIVVYVRPSTFEGHLKATKLMFKQMNIAKSTEATSEVEIAKVLSNSFTEISKLNFEILVDNVLSVEAPNIPEPVTNKDHINEFIMNITAKEAETISTLIKTLGEIGLDNKLPVVCEECKHEWITVTSFDPTSFFTQS